MGGKVMTVQGTLFVVGDVVHIVGPVTLMQTIWNAGGDPYGLWRIKKIFQSETEEPQVLIVAPDNNTEFTVSLRNIVIAKEVQP